MLVFIKVVHTTAWAFFVTCILGIYVYASLGRFTVALILIGVVFVEVLVLLLNQMRCPLTPIAARYTHERQDNFDIYLPLFLARHNKTIFGTLYVLGLLYTITLWIISNQST